MPTQTPFPSRSPAPPTFPSLSSPKDSNTSPFTVSPSTGFLPLSPPLATLPPAFKPLADLLAQMPILLADGVTPGLLATGGFGAAVRGLPDLTGEIDALVPADHEAGEDGVNEGGDGGRKGRKGQVLAALFRDYGFVASGYLLEPCHLRFLEARKEGKEGGGKGKGVYGLGRQRLPACVARPLNRVAELAGFKPFMEYAGTYALYNWHLADPAQGMVYDNMRLIRAFEHGLDPTSSEAGFVLVHVEMVKHSGRLVKGAVKVLDSCGNGGGEGDRDRDREGFERGLREIVGGMKEVNAVMDGMWKKSKPNDYNSFRTFIFGITKQSMFPHGVVYEGVSEEPMSFRGESGANDSMIPLCDNLLEIDMPDTPLTEILNDFRNYRPGNHREFLEWVRDRAQDVGVREFALADRGSAALYLQALDQVRDFRWRHWCFTREYILKKTSHPTATGGSPIVLWLPNQLFSVYDQMLDVEKMHGSLPGCQHIMELVESQRHTLDKEVQKFCAERDI